MKMHWVKVTRADGAEFWVNLDRFDTMFFSAHEEHPHDQITVLRATLSETEEDYYEVVVREKPEEIIKTPQ